MYNVDKVNKVDNLSRLQLFWIPKKTLRFEDMSTDEKESFPCQP